LSASGKITDEEYRAAQRYRNMAFRWLHAIGAPYPFAQACDAEFTIAGLMKMPRDSDCARIEHEYKQANSAILGPDGNRRGVATAVRNVVVYEAEPRSEFEFELLRVGLASLVSHFGKVVKVVSFRPDITTAA
jgi:hypothetical protein